MMATDFARNTHSEGKAASGGWQGERERLPAGRALASLLAMSVLLWGVVGIIVAGLVL